MDRQTILEQLNNDVFNVTFTKLDGTDRTMRVTLRKDIIPSPKAEDPASQTKVRKINENVIVAWCVDKSEWRSFRVNSVKSLEPVNVQD